MYPRLEKMGEREKQEWGSCNMTIRINPQLIQRVLCKLGYHRWQCVGSWEQETKANVGSDWYAWERWYDYYCPFCGKWERASSHECGLSGNEVMRNWVKYPTIKLPDIIRDPREVLK
jgi:hypothetical protein